MAALDVATSAVLLRARLPTGSHGFLVHHQAEPVPTPAVCSFCSTETPDVVAGPGVFVCSSCVGAATAALAGRTAGTDASRLAATSFD